MSSFNGFGTTLYGKTNIEKDGSYVATNWIIIAFIPIIPVSTYQVKDGSSDFQHYGIGWSQKDKFLVKKIPLNLAQIFRTYLLMISFVVIIVALVKIF